MDTNGTTFNGSLFQTTVAKATSKPLTFVNLKKTVDKMKLDSAVQDIHKGVAKKWADMYDSMVYSMMKQYNIPPERIYFHREFHTDWENHKFKMILKPRMYGKTAAYHLGIDLGREDDMCIERTEDYEDRLRETVRQYEENHLGATIERFIEMAREGGRSEHLGNLVREQEQKIHELSHALMRANEQVAYSDNETDKANKRAQAWQERAVRAENLYYGLREKNRKANAKKKAPAKKTSKK